ncbi:MAG: aminopeptidase P family protein [Candidatus Goldbacteria bacterium]|nr:aminopeptidase P family protein [Candidatus Goldiibacteriota bacterium]
MSRLIKSIKKNNFFYIANPLDIFYLSGFFGSFARLLISNEKKFFITDKRYNGVAEKLGIDKLFEIIVTNNYKKEIKKIIKKFKKILISPQTPLTEYLWLKDSGFEPKVSNKILNLRMIKDEKEIELIKKSIEITEKGILHILSLLKNNITEKEIADEFEYYIKKTGADSASFPPIIAFGQNSAIPHYKTDTNKLNENSIILIDVGSKYKGYCSDLTRVIGYRIIKSHLKKYINYYNIVKTAKNKAVLLCENRNLTKRPYFFVKKYLNKYGLDKFFTHSLGHGIGLDIHEMPFINQKSVLKFKPGMIITCEPGIYFQNEFGIRIEDDYLITEKKLVKLSNLSDEIIIID